MTAIGMTYERWTVIGRAAPRGGRACWRCRCVCGRVKTVLEKNLRNGKSGSCGCLMRERSAQAHTRHGGHRTRLYRIWQNMLARCSNIRNKSYDDYGGRGICVCKRWQGRRGFAEFRNDMGEPPLGHSLERKKNGLGYFPTNCMWATRVTQNRNKRSNRYGTYKGQTKLLIDWAREYGLIYQTLYGRVIYYGWSMQQALTTPAYKSRT